MHPLAPPPDLMEAQQTGPVKIRQWDGEVAWVVTRFEEIRSAMSDKRVSADPTKPGFPEKSAAYKQIMGQDHNLRTMDDPEHAVQKRMLLQDFSTRRVEEMRPAIRDTVHKLIDAMLARGNSAELVKDFALAVPTMVICEILGVPYRDRDWFADLSQECTSSVVAAEVASAAGKQLYEYLDKLMTEKDKDPKNDLLSRLVVEQVRPGLLSRKDAIELARFILIAGHETTANMIALSTLALLMHPEQAARLKTNEDPAFLTNAVDELFRYVSVAHNGRRRVAVGDLQLGDQLIKAGEGLILMNNVGDRDESVFPDADKLDLARPNARQHLAFGAGTHKCLGFILSKCELELVHGALWKRLPDLRLAVPFNELQFNEGGPVHGLFALPVRWGA
jgi:cytochrome P450